MSIQSATEDIRESDNVIDLVRIVGTSGCHQYIGTGCHGIFVRDFRRRIGQREYDRHGSHAAYHILAQYISFGQTEEYIRAFDSFFQCMDICTVGCKISLLFVQVGTCLADYAFTVDHDDIFKACAQ